MDAQTIVERIEQTETPDSAWLTRIIREGPLSGVNGGGHGWLYKAAKGLFYYRRRHKLTEQDLFTVLRAKADGYERRVPDDEIQDALESAARHLEDPDYQTGTTLKAWPEPEYEKVSEIVTAGFGFRELKEASPVNPYSDPVTSDQVVSCLFSYRPGVSDPLICAAKELSAADTKPLSNWLAEVPWLRLGRQAFIVPSRMTRLQGLKHDGAVSPRCLDNTGDREYLVVECDIAKEQASPWRPWVKRWEQAGITIADVCAAVLWHLHTEAKAPFVLAVHSGGKSIHGWFPCRGISEEKLKEFMHYAVRRGADPKTWSRCQFVRMPGGLRAPKVRQEILYYDPANIEARAVKGVRK